MHLVLLGYISSVHVIVFKTESPLFFTILHQGIMLCNQISITFIYYTYSTTCYLFI